MADLSADFRTFGMIEGPFGPVVFVLGILIARNPRFLPWLGICMQYFGVALTLAGAIGYFQPFGIEMSQHAIGLIFIITLVLVAVQYRRARGAAKGSPQ